jgi:CRISPR-associated protein Cmr5
MRTRTQEFALRAYPCIEDQVNADTRAKYRTLALSFPNMILQSGLSQATGFLLAKGCLEHTAYLNDLAHIMALCTRQFF